MNEVINLSEMPKLFNLCNQTECPCAGTCLRQILYPEIAGREQPLLDMINPVWAAKQKKPCKYYLKNEKVRRARGFKCTTRAIPSGSISSFRSSAIHRIGYKRYYQGRRGDILLTPEEEAVIIRLAKKYGVQRECYFDSYEYVLVWG